MWRRRSRVGVLALAAVFSLGNALPPVAEAGDDTTRLPTVQAWIPYWLATKGVSSVRKSGVVSVASPYWFTSPACGVVRGTPGAGSKAVLKRLAASDVTVVPMLTAPGLTPQKAIACFGSTAKRKAHVKRLVALARSSKAYAGLDLDYEHLAYTTSTKQAARVRAAYSLFVADLCSALRRHGKLCFITVLPRTTDKREISHGRISPGVFDYAAIGGAADQIRVMAYDQHIKSANPGPIAGMPWVRRVMAYTLSKVPAEKVALGIPLYARDFSPRSVTALPASQAVALMRSKRKTLRFDPVQRESYFTYRKGGLTHRVWVSDKRSVAERYALASELGLAGVALWGAGQEQPGTWSRIAAAR